MRRFASLLALMVAAQIHAAAADILVGVAGPMTGQYGPLGLQAKAGAEAAAAKLNAAGGINGEALSVVVADDACDTKKAVEAARSFATQDVRLVVGHYCSGASAAAAVIYANAGILMMTPAASAPSLTEEGRDTVFRVTGRDDAYLPLAVKRAGTLSNAKTAIVFPEGAEPSGITKATKVTKLPLPKATEALVATATTLIDGQFTAAILAVPPADATRLLKVLLDQGFTGTIFADQQFLLEGAPDDMNWPEAGGTLLALFPEDPMTNPLAAPAIEQLKAASAPSEGAALPAYAAVEMFVAAAKANSVNDTMEMAAWLHNGNPVETALGQLAFDAKGDLVRQPFTWYRWVASAKRFVPE